MNELITVFRSNIPIDCHIIKGRLETEGIQCLIFDENIVWVHPFYAVAIGGVKLKVPFDKYTQSKEIINLTKQGKLIDENGEYSASEVFINEIGRQNEILSIKNQVRNNPLLLDTPSNIESKYANQIDFDKLIKTENEFQKFTVKKFVFSWKQFFYELFDFDRSVFKYFRTKPVDYYLEKEIVENFINKKESEINVKCPNCNSDNVIFGYAIDFKWDILYILVSVLLGSPLFLIRKKFHCFDCGHDFNKNKCGSI